MRIQMILNRVQKFQSFVYGEARLVEGFPKPALEVELRSRANSRPICSGCGKKRPGYDVLPVRRHEFIPFWGLLVFFPYARRRVDCPSCGVKAEALPWAEGKHRLATLGILFGSLGFLISLIGRRSSIGMPFSGMVIGL